MPETPNCFYIVYSFAKDTPCNGNEYFVFGSLLCKHIHKSCCMHATTFKNIVFKDISVQYEFNYMYDILINHLVPKSQI